MFRSLHMKLMLIMTLLIILLMTVVGAFLINSVANYYTQDFYTQMSEAFQDEVFWSDLTTPTPGEEDGAASIAEILNTYNGTLGVDNRSRKYYVLDGSDGHWLAGSDDQDADEPLDMDSRNLMRVLAGEEKSDDSTPSASYMDVAVAVQRGGQRYIIYVRDDGTNAAALNSELITLIVEALVFGLVISVLLSFLLSKTRSGWPTATSPRSWRWPPGMRSASSPAPSTTWPGSSTRLWKRWRTNATSWAPSFST